MNRSTYIKKIKEIWAKYPLDPKIRDAKIAYEREIYIKTSPDFARVVEFMKNNPPTSLPELPIMDWMQVDVVENMKKYSPDPKLVDLPVYDPTLDPDYKNKSNL